MCRENFAPPVVKINLDEAAEQRWTPLQQLFDKDFLQKAASQVIE